MARIKETSVKEGEDPLLLNKDEGGGKAHFCSIDQGIHDPDKDEEDSAFPFVF